MSDKRFVYILRSDADPHRHYTGITSDVEARLRWLNSGPSGMTIPDRPWSLVVALEFADARLAGRFERYLKTGSGRAFAKRHLGLSHNRSSPSLLDAVSRMQRRPRI